MGTPQQPVTPSIPEALRVLPGVIIKLVLGTWWLWLVYTWDN